MSKYKWNLILLLLCSMLLISCGSTKQVESEEEEETVMVIVDPRENAEEAKVYFNRQSGFYEEFDLEMYCPVEYSAIYYTTDGTIPNSHSKKYEGPITLTDRTGNPEIYAARTDYNVESDYVPIERIVKGNIIRAIVYFEDGTCSDITNGTFIIGQNRKKLYGKVPVISLITDPDNLFNEETGILILGNRYKEWLDEDPMNATRPDWEVQGNFSNRGKEWERPVAFEYMPADGNNLSADMGLRTKGGSTRTYVQKSLRLYAREEYGTKNIKAELIPGNMKSDGSEEITKYKTIVLRNGGNDNNFGKLRDPLIQTLASDRHFDTQQSTPCVVFLDGEYWGLYAITEDYTDNYIETNYGVDKDNVVIVKRGEIDEGEDEDIALYEELYDFVTSHDMSKDIYYAQAAEMIDLPGFLDYVALSLYVDNHDSLFEDNNWSVWRVREADGATPWSDGKWRFLLYDTEYSSGIYDGGAGFDVDTISDKLDSMSGSPSKYGTDYPLINIFESLYRNDQFREALVLTLCDLRNYNFSQKRFSEVFDKIAPDYQRLAGDSFYRYGPDWVVNWNEPSKYFEQKLNEVKIYFNGRYQAFPDLMKSAFRVGKPVKVTITVSDTGKGSVRLNQTDLDLMSLDNETFSGDYFAEYPITLQAQPKDGCKFVNWKVSGGNILKENGETITIQPTKKCTIEAVYE